MSDLLSAEFAEFAALAGYTVGTVDELETVWNRGGEIRFSIAAGPALAVRRAERAGDPVVVLSTDSPVTVERYLTAQLAPDLRSHLGFEPLLFLRALGDFTPAEVYEVRAALGGYDLIDLAASHSVGVFNTALNAARHSFYADAPVDLMRESFRAPQGEPLFRDAWRRWQDREPV